MSGNQVGRRTADGGKSKNNMSTPQWGGHNVQLGLRIVIYHNLRIELQVWSNSTCYGFREYFFVLFDIGRFKNFSFSLSGLK